MATITAYKCEVTGEIFEKEAQYIRHTKNLLAQQRKEEKLMREKVKKEKWWQDNFWNRVKSIDQLKAAILQHRDVLAKNGLENCFHHEELLPTPILKIHLGLGYSSAVSNTHSCPHDGVTNFNRNKDKPQSYKGWCGRIDYWVLSYKDQSYSYPGSSDMWINTRIHTCSGGGGGARMQNGKFIQSFGYGVNMFYSDWPAMADEYEKAKVWIALKGDKVNINIDNLVNEWNPFSKY